MAPGGASYRLPEVRDGCSAHFGRKCCRCGFGSCEEWRRWSSSVPLGTDVVFCFSWVDNMKQYIVISGYCIIDNMTFQPSALVWLPVVRLPRYFAPGCLSPHCCSVHLIIHQRSPRVAERTKMEIHSLLDWRQRQGWHLILYKAALSQRWRLGRGHCRMCQHSCLFPKKILLCL